MSENALFQGYFTEVTFDTSEGNQISYFQNGYFSKFFGDFISKIIRLNAGTGCLILKRKILNGYEV